MVLVEEEEEEEGDHIGDTDHVQVIILLLALPIPTHQVTLCLPPESSEGEVLEPGGRQITKSVAHRHQVIPDLNGDKTTPSPSYGYIIPARNTHTHTRTHARTHACTRTCAHTHTHTHSCVTMPTRLEVGRYCLK